MPEKVLFELSAALLCSQPTSSSEWPWHLCHRITRLTRSKSFEGWKSAPTAVTVTSSSPSFDSLQGTTRPLQIPFEHRLFRSSRSMRLISCFFGFVMFRAFRHDCWILRKSSYLVISGDGDVLARPVLPALGSALQSSPATHGCKGLGMRPHAITSQSS